MRVIFLNNFYYHRGGSERVLFKEMKMLKEAGHEVAVFSRTNPMNEPTKYARHFPPEIETDRFTLSVGALKTVKELVYSDAAREGLHKLIDEFKPDIAHAHNIYGRLSLSVLDALKEKAIPTVLTLHDYKLLCPSYLMLNHGEICERCKGKRFIRAVLTKCHKNSFLASAVYAFESWFNHRFGKYDSVKWLLSPSRFLLDKVIDFGWNPERIIFLPNFIDQDEIVMNDQPGTYLLYFGRLSREKGVKTVLKSLAEIKKPVPLVVVGDGPERADLEKYAADRNLNVRFVGYLSGATLNHALAQAKAVVVPSECYENAPMTILESFAHGKPVIGARIGGIPEMIDEGVDGYLFRSGDVDDLRSRIEQIMGLKDNGCVQMGKAGREKVLRLYSRNRHYTELMTIYRKAMNR